MIKGTWGTPTTMKYKPLIGWLAKAICSWGPIMFDIVMLEFFSVLWMYLAVDCNIELINQLKTQNTLWPYLTVFDNEKYVGVCIYIYTDTSGPLNFLRSSRSWPVRLTAREFLFVWINLRAWKIKSRGLWREWRWGIDTWMKPNWFPQGESAWGLVISFTDL